MKKILLFVILIQYNFLFSQTPLATFPLEFKNSKDYRQIINTEDNKTHDLFAFATDKKTLTILKYNNALFLTNQYAFAKKNISHKSISGYSFSDDGNPTLYWSSEDLQKITAVTYDLNTKTNTSVNYDLRFFKQIVITQFQENNTFYILTQKYLEQKLLLYIFKDGKKEEKTLDFSSFKFKNSINLPIRFNQILIACPAEKIETNQFNPLFKATQKSKLYVLKNQLLLTFDHDYHETQAFFIDLATFEIQEKKFSKTDTQSFFGPNNSYYHEGKIYQFKVCSNQLLFEIRDYKTAEIVKSIYVAPNQTIPFKSSPIWLQLNNDKPTEIQTTARLLNQMQRLDVGLTVYKTSKSILITFGGIGELEFSDTVHSFTFDNELTSDIEYRNVPMTIYFESIFDKKLDHIKQDQEPPLAVDFISRFKEEHKEISLPSIIRYKNYYIMGYYNTKTKQYTMRKFSDGFETM